MGSKLRRLRVKAAAAGERYRAELRANARKVDRARRLAEEVGSKVDVSSDPPGAPLPDRFTAKEFAPVALAAVAGSPLASNLAFHATQIEAERRELTVLLGEPDASERAAEALKGSQTSALTTLEAIENAIDRARRPPASAMRLSRLQQVMASSSLLASGTGLKGDR